MNQRLLSSLVLVALSLLCLSHVGCRAGGRVADEQFDKIQNGMALKEVETILGGPGEEVTNPNDILLQAAKHLEIKTSSSTTWKRWGVSGKMIGVAFGDEGKVVAKLKISL